MSTADQRLDALRNANAVRMTNAHTVRTVRAKDRRGGAAHAAAILRDPRGVEPAMRVGALLRAVRSIGSEKARRRLATVGVDNDRKRIGEMTARQRRVLADGLERLR